MSYIFEAVLYIFNGILLTWYCSAFLLVKANRRRIHVLVVFAGAYIMLRYAVEYLPVGYLPYPVLSIMKTVIMAVCMFGLSLAFYKKELGKQIFLAASFFAVLDICSLITVRIVSVISDLYLRFFGDYILQSITTAEQAESYMRAYNGVNHIMLFVVHAVLCFFAVRSIAKGFKFKDEVLKMTDVLAITLPCVSILAVSFAMRAVLFGMTGGEQILHGISGILFTAAAVFLLLTLIVSVRMTQKSILLHTKEKNSAIMREQIRQIRSQDNDGIYAELRSLRHDMKNHLANISLLAKTAAEGNTEAAAELSKYTGKMNEALALPDFTHNSGNPVTDVVIWQRHNEAKRKHIKFESEFSYPSGLDIDAYDIAVILSNALDNAFDACEKVSEPERFVRLASWVKGIMFFIELSNSYEGELIFDERTGLPASSKPDSDEHGLGLLGIKRIAHKYLGGIDVHFSEDNTVKLFTLTVMLQARA